jgi:glycosyltransferase involved in cell wall biosynthesis
VISVEEIEERSKPTLSNAEGKKELRVLFLGNVMGRKGLFTLLEATRLSTFDLRLDIVGSLTSEPEYAKQMQEYIAQNNLSSIVFLHGSLNNQPLIEKLKSAHVLVVPSSYEGFGIVYLEGMGFGLPAIGTTAGAAGEVIRDGVDGFLIQPGDAHSLATKLQIMNERRDVLVQMSLAARTRYLAQPKWNQTANQIREFLLSFM